ncbi:MAG: inorganic phosphate transporter, PiT family [Chloroflexota bacterium]|jgi:PiT family inorganic phosphate transporter|nr:inorganic phosphate transporter, PiT family [Chloroflexota bacterium]
MTANLVIVLVVVMFGLMFDFTNGFHDTANAMATSIATGALTPRVAVALSGVLNFVGAFLGLSVAATIATGIVDAKVVTTTTVFAGLVGAITWNLLTWLLGLPSSWLVTIPVAASFGGAANAIARGVGGVPGVIVTALIAVGVFLSIWMMARRTPITANNVNNPIPAGARSALALDVEGSAVAAA